jgi:hypothetical protein
MSITYGVLDVGARIARYVLGGLLFFGPTVETVSAANDSGQAIQVSTLTVDSAVASTVYTWTFEGVEYTVTSPASGATVTTIAAQIVAEMQGSPVAGAAATFESAVGVVTITGLQPGQSFSLSDSDANLTSATVTSAASAGTVAFGRGLLRGDWDADDGIQFAKLPVSTALTAQVTTLTITYSANAVYNVIITVRGVTYPIPVLADTNSDTTATAIRAAINAAMPASTVIATGATNVVILTAEVAGQAFIVSATSQDPTDVAIVATTAGTDLGGILGIPALFGVSQRNAAVPYAEVDDTDAVYPANSVMSVVRKGVIAVTYSTLPAIGDAVYLETSGASAGLFFTTGSSTRVWLPPSLARWQGQSDSTVTLAALQIAA